MAIQGTWAHQRKRSNNRSTGIVPTGSNMSRAGRRGRRIKCRHADKLLLSVVKENSGSKETNLRLVKNPVSNDVIISCSIAATLNTIWLAHIPVIIVVIIRIDGNKFQFFLISSHDCVKAVELRSIWPPGIKSQHLLGNRVPALKLQSCWSLARVHISMLLDG